MILYPNLNTIYYINHLISIHLGNIFDNDNLLSFLYERKLIRINYPLVNRILLLIYLIKAEGFLLYVLLQYLLNSREHSQHII